VRCTRVVLFDELICPCEQRRRHDEMAQGGGRRRCTRQDDVRLEAERLCCISLETFEIAAGPAIFEADILPRR
jgi:hypothetical protein